MPVRAPLSQFAMRMLLVLIAASMSAPQVQAGASDWVDLAPETRVRLVSSDALTVDGRTMIAVDLEMPAGTKTYWRAPGETGIPTEFDLSHSVGIAAAEPLWPYPLIDRKDGYTDFAYYGHVVIPLELELTGEFATVDLSLIIGICSEICVPATARLVLPLDFSRPDPGQALRIEQALAEVPLPWPGDSEVIREVVYDAPRQTLSVSLDPEVVDPHSLLAEPLDNPHAIGAPQNSPEDGIVILRAIGSTDGGFGGGDVRFTFMTAEGPYEVIRNVQPSTRR